MESESAQRLEIDTIRVQGAGHTARCPVCRSPRHIPIAGTEWHVCQGCGCRYRPVISSIIDQLEAERAIKMKTLEAVLDEIKSIDDRIAGEQLRLKEKAA